MLPLIKLSTYFKDVDDIMNGIGIGIGIGIDIDNKNDDDVNMMIKNKNKKIELFSNEKIREIEKKFLKLENEKFKKLNQEYFNNSNININGGNGSNIVRDNRLHGKLNSLYFILKNKPNSIPIQILIEKGFLKKNEIFYFKNQYESTIKITENGKFIFNNSKLFTNLSSLIKKEFQSNSINSNINNSKSSNVNDDNELFWNLIQIKRDDKYITLNEIRFQFYEYFDMKFPNKKELNEEEEEIDDDDDENINYKIRFTKNIILKKKIKYL